MTKKEYKQPLPGEGDREAARRYNRKSEAFVSSKSGVEARRQVMGEEAEHGKVARGEAARRAKGRDPEETRDHTKPA